MTEEYKKKLGEEIRTGCKNIEKWIYIAGPISNLPEEEYTANFERAEKFLRDNGYEPINPLKIYKTKNGQSQTPTEMCGGIYMLNDWLNSEGARYDYANITSKYKKGKSRTRNYKIFFEKETKIQYFDRLIWTHKEVWKYANIKHKDASYNWVWYKVKPSDAILDDVIAFAEKNLKTSQSNGEKL